MKAFVKILMLAAILTVSVDAVAISKSKFMVKAMDKMVGEPETVLLDNLGRPDKPKLLKALLYINSMVGVVLSRSKLKTKK